MGCHTETELVKQDLVLQAIYASWSGKDLIAKSKPDMDSRDFCLKRFALNQCCLGFYELKKSIAGFNPLSLRLKSSLIIGFLCSNLVLCAIFWCG